MAHNRTPVCKNDPYTITPDTRSADQRRDHALTALTDYTIAYSKRLGKGAFASVYEGVCKGKPAAIKIPSCNDSQTIASMKREITIFEIIAHSPIKTAGTQYLIQYYGYIADKCAIVIELATLGCLADILLDSTKDLPMPIIREIMRQITQGIDALHQYGIIHKDIKADNMLLSLDGANSFAVKIMDFGLSRHVEEEKVKPTFCGTPFYAAPETLNKISQDKRADVYAMGITFWGIVTRKNTKTDLYPTVSTYNELQDEVVNNNARPILPDTCPSSLRNIIRQCWDADPALRPSANQCANQLKEYIARKEQKENTAPKKTA